MTLTKVQRGLTQKKVGHKGNPVENFAEFVHVGPLDLDAQTIGNGRDLADVYVNAFAAGGLIRRMAEEMGKHGLTINPRDRANAAGLNILAAAQMVSSALLTHLRASSWYVNGTLVLLRTAINLAVRGGAIAIGTADEATRFFDGPNLPTPRERKAAEFDISKCCEVLAPHVTSREPHASPPLAVYKWLCAFTHLDAKVLGKPPTHEDAYAAIAYVSWLCAAFAEIVTGVPDLAVWPKRWPASLPWER